jgi:hypothetical protein
VSAYRRRQTPVSPPVLTGATLDSVWRQFASIHVTTTVDGSARAKHTDENR